MQGKKQANSCSCKGRWKKALSLWESPSENQEHSRSRNNKIKNACRLSRSKQVHREKGSCSLFSFFSQLCGESRLSLPLRSFAWYSLTAAMNSWLTVSPWFSFIHFSHAVRCSFLVVFMHGCGIISGLLVETVTLWSIFHKILTSTKIKSR